ncbi:MAG: hypothetical protein K2X03_13950 [Bryobacteraceae bacterium]|nr:hypothetical protein [Bryobacteraceae bacterium]
MVFDPGKQVVAHWREGQTSDIALLQTAKIDAVWLETPQPEFATACAAAGILVTGPLEPGKLETVKGGLWPGIRSAGRRRTPDGEVASASAEPWVDANGYLVACQRALEPSKTPLLAYDLGDAATRMVAFETLEIALAEAWLMGGNFALQVEDRYLRALRAGDAKARAAWAKLGQTSAWLKQNRALFGRPALPVVTALYDGRGGSRELVNLLCRRNASPAVVTTAPKPSPAIKALVAASVTPPTDKAPWLAQAAAGGLLVVDSDWWRDPAAKPLREEEDRRFFALGKGQVVEYRKRIAEPSEFALDVIDLVTHRQRALRLWNAPAIIGTRGGNVVTLLNYGVSVPEEIQLHTLGHFTRALLHVAGASPVALKVAKRAAMTEVFLPRLERACAIEFS